MRKNPKINRDSMKKGIYMLPNLFTTASLFFGFYSIITSIRGDFPKAAIAIIISCILDGLDGKIARVTNTTSKFGAEYDSLSDLVAFGMAPAVLVYLWALVSFGRYGWLSAFLFVVCGALRLARFNVQIDAVDSKVFNGLAIPAAAVVIATTVLFFQFLGGKGQFNHVSVLSATVALSLLMVSNIKYYSFKDLDFFSRKPFMTFVLIIIMLIIIVLEPQVMLFVLALGYSLSGPGWVLYRIAKKQKQKQKQENVESYNNRI
ncbi:MAG: CDP-diacylglycerol--serine O-phosphatidyltransferase [Thermodesulfobacteriota bacterium]|nr:CDP-diacylglycerol--serine O-phosphatidyltransferase [Thermodesulfobacteriota bacterium]